MILAREVDRPAVEQVVRLQQSLGVDARLIGPEEIRELSPNADLTHIVAGCIERKSGYADPRATVYALAHRAQEKGAVIEQLTEAQAIRARGERIEAVVTNHGEISTRVVVNCAGPWAGKVGQMVGVDYSLRFSRELDIKFQLPASHAEFPVTADPPSPVWHSPRNWSPAIPTPTTTRPHQRK
jgi:sarcosine oxidase subunit beta